MHDVSNSSFNHDGVLDIGATTGRDFNLPYMTTEQQALYKYQVCLAACEPSTPETRPADDQTTWCICLPFMEPDCSL